MREYEDTTLEQLEAFVCSGLTNRRQLEDIATELLFRSGSRAMDLTALIQGLLAPGTRNWKIDRVEPAKTGHVPTAAKPQVRSNTNREALRVVRCSVCEMPAIPGDSVCYTHNN